MRYIPFKRKGSNSSPTPYSLLPTPLLFRRKGSNSSPTPYSLLPTPFVFLLILLWSLAMGWGLALSTSAQPNGQVSQDGTVDQVPGGYKLGQELYLENCSSCHIALPPAVFPTQTWQQLLQEEQHYGQQLTPLVDPPRLLVWNYLKTFSRPAAKDEQTPYRVDDSRYFKALHPRVKLPNPVDVASCASCHPSAAQYNFRSLTPEWQNSQ